MNKTLLVMAGGTGGHIFPGLALADALRNKGWTIQWLGTAQRMEAQLVPQAGYPIHFIDVAGVRGNGLLRLLGTPFKIVKAITQAITVIRTIKPDVVIGFGGFASGPGGVAAWLLGKPLLVHEQNAVPGLTNRWLARIAKRVLTGFDQTFVAQDKNDKYRWVGNPVRPRLALVAPKKVSEQLRVLVLGGSLGAKALNDHVPLACEGLNNIEIRHQCGAGHHKAVIHNYQQSKMPLGTWQVEEFVSDMVDAYEWADLIICRAGALTVSEVAAAGCCAIFVPLPHAVDDHQTKNALSLVNVKAGLLLAQAQLEIGALKPLLEKCLANRPWLVDMSMAAKRLAKLDAVDKVAASCIELVEQAA